MLEYARYPANFVRVKSRRMAGLPAALPGNTRQERSFSPSTSMPTLGANFGRAPSLKQALAYGMIFNEMLRHTDFLTMAAHTMGTSTLDFNRTASTLNTLGLVFKMYSNDFPGSIPVESPATRRNRTPKYPWAPISPRQTPAVRPTRLTCSQRLRPTAGS